MENNELRIEEVEEQNGETEVVIDPTGEISSGVSKVNEKYRKDVMSTFFEIREGIKNRTNNVVGMKKDELAHLRKGQQKEQERLKEKIAIRDYYLKNFKHLTFRLADEIHRVRTKEKYKYLCRKILSSWKEYTETKKQKKRMKRMARLHYENRLKRMIIFKWYIFVTKMKQLNNINVWEDKINQRIGDLKNKYGLVLHEKIEELNRVQELLDVELKEKEALQNNLKKALMRGVCAMNNKFLEILKEEEQLDAEMNERDVEENRKEEMMSQQFEPVTLQTGLGFDPLPRESQPMPHPQPQSRTRITSQFINPKRSTAVRVQRATRPDSRTKPKTRRPRKRAKGFKNF